MARWQVLAVVAAAGVLSSCSILTPGDTGLTPDEQIAVTTTQAPSFMPQQVKVKEITTDLSAPVKDEGLKVTWENQGVYGDTVRGSVITIKLTNDNDVPLPVDAFGPPTLEVGSGSTWTKIDLLPYDPELNSDVNPPGLDYPLGAHASTNLQYRVDTTVGNLYNARLHIGNVTWIGNLNL